MNRLDSLKAMKSFNAVALLINSNARIEFGYGIPGKLYDYGCANNTIISDRETFLNLQTEFPLLKAEEIGDYVRFSMPQFPTLDDVMNDFIRKEMR